MGGDHVRAERKVSGAFRSIPFRHPPATAGIHPLTPVLAFSQRTAYTSVRARNRSV